MFNKGTFLFRQNLSFSAVIPCHCIRCPAYRPAKPSSWAAAPAPDDRPSDPQLFCRAGSHTTWRHLRNVSSGWIDSKIRKPFQALKLLWDIQIWNLCGWKQSEQWPKVLEWDPNLLLLKSGAFHPRLLDNLSAWQLQFCMAPCSCLASRPEHPTLSHASPIKS